MNSAFSEYVLYEPILRILIARGYSVTCESPFPLFERPVKKRGDHKRIDFVAVKPRLQIALEVKWAKTRKVNVKKDYEKLRAFKKKHPRSHAILCVFGQWNATHNLSLSGGAFAPRLKPIYALMRATQYGCHIYQLKTS
jgi:hypothetical protein